MNQTKRKLWLIIAIMIVVLAGLIGVLLNQQEQMKQGEIPVAAVEETTAGQAADQTAGDGKKEEQTTEVKTDAGETATEQKAEEKTSDEKTGSVRVEITDGGGWQQGDEYIRQFNVVCTNQSGRELSNWEVDFCELMNVKVHDSWNVTLKQEGDTLKATSVSYNEKIGSGQSVDFGFQIGFESEQKAKAAKVTGRFLVDGEVVEEQGTEIASDEKKTEEATEKVSEDTTAGKAEAEQGTPVANHGKLSVKGTDLVDSKGQKYQLKGASTHGLQWFPEYISKDTFLTIRDDWGANLIRLALYTDENGYCSGGNQEKLKGLVEDGVQYATELGMYVIIDWHVLHDLTPKKYQSEAEKFFDEMSKKYADYDNVLYEICNEPNGGTGWSEVKEYAEDIIPVIRKNDPDAIIIVGTPNWSQDVDLAAKDPVENAENVMYALHFYAATHKDDLRNKLRTAHDLGLPVFISEYSICDASGNGGIDYDSAEEWKKLIREYNLSYAEWSICNKDESASLIAPGNSKVSGWSEDELSETGKWLKKMLQEN